MIRRYAFVPRFRPGYLAFALLGFALCACSSLRYYAQAVHGQGELVLRRQPVRKLLRDPATDPKLAARLSLALAARAFASR
ncbi:aminopeptidase, partial [Staphylococcus aureus]|uniref:aminopeptidase n=1 Tax=Staphylococcus aureus TaxID=1280 RepID=UPI0039BDEB4F